MKFLFARAIGFITSIPSLSPSFLLFLDASKAIERDRCNQAAFLAVLISQIYVLPLVYGTPMSSISADRCANNIRGLRRAVWINHTAATSWLRRAALRRKEIHAYTTSHMPPAKWRVTFEIWAFRFATFTGEFVARGRDDGWTYPDAYSPVRIKYFFISKLRAHVGDYSENSAAVWTTSVKILPARNEIFLFRNHFDTLWCVNLPRFKHVSSSPSCYSYAYA